MNAAGTIVLLLFLLGPVFAFVVWLVWKYIGQAELRLSQLDYADQVVIELQNRAPAAAPAPVAAPAPAAAV